MLKLILVATLSLASTAVATEPARTVTYGRSYGSASQPLPAFDKGYLLFTNGSNGLDVWGPDGQRAFETVFSDPPVASVMSAAVDDEGTVAVGVGYLVPEGYAGGIILMDHSGKQLRFVKTDRYMPSHLSFDMNHVLWTFGWQRDARDNGTEDSGTYLLFRKFSLDGKQLGAYVPRSLFPKPGLTPGSGRRGLWSLRVAGERVGALADSGQTSENREWIELDLKGDLIGHWKLGRDAHGGMAFTLTNGLCRQIVNSGKPEIECFDRDTGAWKKLTKVSALGEDGRPLGILLGADGDNLVFGHGAGDIRASWVPIPEPVSETGR